MTSVCGKCNGTFFELVEQAPRNSYFKLFFVQCTACKKPVGVLEYFNTSTQVGKLGEKVQDLSRKLDNLEYLIRKISK